MLTQILCLDNFAGDYMPPAKSIGWYLAIKQLHLALHQVAHNRA